MADALIASVESADSNAENSLLQLKLAIAKGQVPNAADCKRILEAACRLSVARRDKDGLERNLAQLRPYGMTHEFYALDLLLLLVESRFSDFFALLETVDASVPDKHIDFVVNLERELTEGSYHNVLRARKNSTSNFFIWLLEDLEHTVRDEVASCIEASHVTLNLQRAAHLLKLDSIESARKFAENREGWVLNGDSVTFPERTQSNQLSKDSIPSEWTIRECLNMAVELDRIV